MLLFPSFVQDLLLNVWDFAKVSFYWWLPFILAIILWNLWVFYTRYRYISGIDWVLLEIKLPREITKTPRAMEVFFNAIHNTYDGDVFEKYQNGFLRSWWSFEIVSINGQVRFFVYSQRFYRNVIEAQFYAQYPDIEIEEVDDYSKAVMKEGFEPGLLCYGLEFGLIKEDVYPIKTYVDYGLHEMGTKEEFKTDPMTALLEHMGSLKNGEQLWIQILIRGTKKKDWKKQGEALVRKLMKRDEKPVEGQMNMGALILSPGERSVVEAVERKVAKVGFDVGIRSFYIASRESFHIMSIFQLLSIFKTYIAGDLNGFKPIKSTSVDYFRKLREPRKKWMMLDAFRKRSYFYMPYVRPPFVLNSEEMATIFHFPGRVAETPTFSRIEAKKGEPPTNLPI